MKKNVGILLSHIIENVLLIEKHMHDVTIEKFLSDRLLQDAVVREIEIIGEAVRNIPQEFKDSHSDIPWQTIAGMRNKVIHEYFDIDLQIIWNTVKNDLPYFKSQIEELRKEV